MLKAKRPVSIYVLESSTLSPCINSYSPAFSSTVRSLYHFWKIVSSEDVGLTGLPLPFMFKTRSHHPWTLREVSPLHRRVLSEDEPDAQWNESPGGDGKVSHHDNRSETTETFIMLVVLDNFVTSGPITFVLFYKTSRKPDSNLFFQLDTLMFFFNFNCMKL